MFSYVEHIFRIQKPYRRPFGLSNVAGPNCRWGSPPADAAGKPGRSLPVAVMVQRQHLEQAGRVTHRTAREGAAYYAGSKTFSSVPMPSIITSTFVLGFIGRTPDEVPQAMMSPGYSVMSCEMALTSRAIPMIMSETG